MCTQMKPVISWNDLAIHVFTMILGGSIVGLMIIGHGGEYLFYGEADDYHFSAFDIIGIIVGLILGAWSIYRFAQDHEICNPDLFYEYVNLPTAGRPTEKFLERHKNDSALMKRVESLKKQV